MSSIKDKAIADVAEVMKFENWLRFYFVQEAGDKTLTVQIPAEQLEDIKRKYPHLSALAEAYDGNTIDYQKSCTQTCAHVAKLYDGVKYPAGLVPGLWDSKELKIEMYVFNLWLQGAETTLDAEFMDFSEWMNGYESWKQHEKVQAYLAQLTDVGDEGGCGCKGATSVQ